MVTINKGTALMDGDAEVVLMELAIGIEAYAKHLDVKPTEFLAEIMTMFFRVGSEVTIDDTN